MTTILDKILLEKKNQVEEILKENLPERKNIPKRPSLFEKMYQSEHYKSFQRLNVHPLLKDLSRKVLILSHKQFNITKQVQHVFLF